MSTNQSYAFRQSVFSVESKFNFPLMIGIKLFAEQSGTTGTNTFHCLFSNHNTLILLPAHLQRFPLILLGQK
ncbi:hypothetical protein CSA08_05045 [Candidatus Gracilibacteria bacterium]|nr:MAG: hypothetical protein CSA08_05045 [Candidatus Gracilibacteria bacterium]